MSVQYADPGVSRCKFDREIADYHAVGGEYRRRGWFLAEAEFPRVLVVLASAKLKPAAVVIGAAFDYTNYDTEPPSVRIVDPFTGEPYKSKELPHRLNRALPAQKISLPTMPAPQRLIVG